jgi:hypothetical protein
LVRFLRVIDFVCTFRVSTNSSRGQRSCRLRLPALTRGIPGGRTGSGGANSGGGISGGGGTFSGGTNAGRGAFDIMGRSSRDALPESLLSDDGFWGDCDTCCFSK